MLDWNFHQFYTWFMHQMELNSIHEEPGAAFSRKEFERILVKIYSTNMTLESLKAEGIWFLHSVKYKRRYLPTTQHELYSN